MAWEVDLGNLRLGRTRRGMHAMTQGSHHEKVPGLGVPSSLLFPQSMCPVILMYLFLCQHCRQSSAEPGKVLWLIQLYSPRRSPHRGFSKQITKRFCFLSPGAVLQPGYEACLRRADWVKCRPDWSPQPGAHRWAYVLRMPIHQEGSQPGKMNLSIKYSG